MTDRVYTARQTLIASAVGGPIGGLYAIWANLIVLDNGAYFVAFLFFGCLPALIYFLIVPFTPWLLSLAALPAFCLGIYNSAKRLNVEKEMVRLGRKWTLQPDRAAFIAGGCALAGSLLLELGWLAFLSERL